MIASPQRKSHLPHSRPPLIPALLVVPVMLTGLYLAGVPWVVTGLDAFWKGVDHLGQYSELLWAVTAISWLGVALLFLRLHRLTQWNQRVLSALRAAMDEAEEIRALGRSVLADLAQARGVPRQDRAWASSMLAALTPQHIDEVPDQEDEKGVNPTEMK